MTTAPPALTPPALTNWAGNVTFRPERVHRPTSLPQLQAVVAGSTRLRVLGTGHSFNRIADTTGDLVLMHDMPPTIEIDTQAAQVRVAGAVRYGELTRALHEAGFALPNLGSLPHISVAGACAAGTHGSGVGNGCLATSVAAVELVTAGGEPVSFRRGDASFGGAVVALGALGVVTHLTLDLLPSFDISQVVYEGLTRDTLHTHLDEVLTSAYSVSVFTDHRAGGTSRVWQKHRVDGQGDEPEYQPDGPEHHPDEPPAATWLDATLADGPRHPVPGADPRPCTEQGGVIGPWHTRLPHFRPDFTPSSGDELQSEYLVPLERAAEALTAIEELSEVLAPLLRVSELRTVAADELWMSPAYGRDSLALHFTWLPDTPRVLAVLPRVEQNLADLGARPHWGKVFTTDPDVLLGLYPSLADFQSLLLEHDPAGMFRNEMVDTYVLPR